LGAIHCITHTIGVADPLWIVHQPIDEANSNATISINAMIKHVSGINSATVFWRQEGTSNFTETNMSFVSDDNWSADITIPSESINVEYYIEAEANSGKSLARPIVAPEGFWTILVENLSNEDWAINNISAPYPNPTNDSVSFNLNQIEGEVEITIHNILGQELYKTLIENGNGIISLNLNKTWNGTLFVSFKGDFGRITKKVIKL